MSQTSFQAKPGEVDSQWYIVDARGQTLGRLAVNIARVLRGKHRPQFTPHVNTGDHVVVINARDVVVTGGKREKKLYDRYSGYPSGRHVRTFEQVMVRDATLPIREAVRGMLQHNTLGTEMFKRLRVYADDKHRHEAQKPTPITFGDLGEIIVASY